MKRDELKINEPCTEDWDAMHESEGAARFCDKCTKDVHNVSNMTRDEARKFLEAHRDSNLCITYRYDARSSEVLFTEPGVRRQRAGLKKLIAAAALLAPLLGGCDTGLEDEACRLPQDQIRPIDLIREQEGAFLSFFEGLFGVETEPEHRVEGAIEKNPPLGSIESGDAARPEIGVAQPDPEPPAADHEIREEFDSQTEPPIRRLMGRRAPTKVESEAVETPPEPEIRQIMGDLL